MEDKNKNKKEKTGKKKGLGILAKMVLMCSLPMIILEVVITVIRHQCTAGGNEIGSF